MTGEWYSNYLDHNKNTYDLIKNQIVQMLNIKELNNFQNLLSKTKEIIIKSELAHMGSSLSLIHIMSFLFVNYFIKKNILKIIISIKEGTCRLFFTHLYIYQK